MTAAAASPRAARDRLLQAIDSQSNICNMVVVLDVISFLEKYPITKEALEETRLGKLINDIRRKTKNEDLAKRAKKLLRNWQKLIEPGIGEISTKSDSKTSRSSNGFSHPHISSSTTTAPNSRKMVCELKSRNDFNNCNASIITETPNRKRKGDHSILVPAKLSKTTPDRTHHLKLSINSNGINGLKIPVSAVKANGSDYDKPLSSSLLLKASVIQQQATSGGQRPTKTPCGSLHGKTAYKTRPPAQNCLTLREESEDIAEVGTSDNSVDHLKPSSQKLEDAMEKQKYLGNCEKEKVRESIKAVKLKDRKLTFDPLTCQIKCAKETDPESEMKPSIEKLEISNNQQVASSYLQHTDWKELSKSESIKSYLNHQSSVLSSVSRSPSISMSQEGKGDKNRHMLLKENPDTDLPGVSRVVNKADVDRLHKQRWSGVNGCFDTKGNWFEWTQCISLDLHEDGSRLDILPYVCLD